LSEANENNTTFLGETKKSILELLLGGPKTSGQIAKELKIQRSAVRIHLDSMQTQKTVKSYFKIVRLGRPIKLYELTENGRELFPRKYDLILSRIINKIEETGGQEHLKNIIGSVADDIAKDIREKIGKSEGRKNLEDSLKVLNSVSNEMGFVSSIRNENDAVSLISRNCILHKVAINNQDTICHGFHDRIIQKTLDGIAKVDVDLKECIASGDKHSRHLITNKILDRS
jgi:DeoR family suf operon transcriptional repressor